MLLPITALKGLAPRSGQAVSPDWLKFNAGACSEAGDGRELRTVKTNHGALVSNFHNGVPRSYRDRKDIALQSAAVSKVQNPNSVVKLKDLQTGEEIAQAIVSMAREAARLCTTRTNVDVTLPVRKWLVDRKIHAACSGVGTSPHATMAPSAQPTLSL